MKEIEYAYRYESPFGGIVITSNGESITGLWFDKQRSRADICGENFQEKDLAVFAQTKKWLDIYFSGQKPDFIPPLSIKTTLFRKAVYEILLSIPYGKTVTYGEIAAKIAEQLSMKQMSAQAVGGAVGHNPISIIIPCHRVIGSVGKLVGYAGGIPLKRELLRLEKIIC